MITSMSNAITRLLQTKSIAVFGASDRPKSLGKLYWENLHSSQQTIWAINPKYRYIQTTPCYATLQDIPTDQIDGAVLCLPASEILPVLSSLPQKKIHWALIPSLEKKDVIQKQWFQELARRAEKRNIILLGADSLGIIFPANALNCSCYSQTVQTGNISLITQSSLVASTFLDAMNATHTGIRSAVVIGTDISHTLIHWIAHFANDPQTKVIALHLEAYENIRALYSVLRYASEKKPVLILRAQEDPFYIAERLSSYKYQKNVGREDVFAALIQQTKSILIHDFETFITTTRLMATHCTVNNANLCIITNSSALASLSASSIQYTNVTLPTIPPNLLQILQRRFQRDLRPVNPIFLGYNATPSSIYHMVKTALQEEEFQAILLILAPTDQLSFTSITKALCLLSEMTTKPILLSWFSSQFSQRIYQAIQTRPHCSLIATPNPKVLIEALGHLATYSVEKKHYAPLSPIAPSCDTKNIAQIRKQLETILFQGRYFTHFQETQNILSTLGLSVITTAFASSIEEVLAIWHHWHKPSIVLKVNTSANLHKVDINGVALDLRTEKEILLAYRQLQKNVKENCPYSSIINISVQPFYPHNPGRVLRIAVQRDSALGPFFEISPGGVAHELNQTASILMPPVRFQDVVDLSHDTNFQKIFSTFRGSSAITYERLYPILQKLSFLIQSIPAIQNIHLNPIVLRKNNEIILDASIQLFEAPLWNDTKYSHFAITPAPQKQYYRQDKNGKRYLIRAIVERDFHIVQEFCSRLSHQTLYQRFISHTPVHHTLITSLTQLDYARECVWGAWDHDKLVALAQWSDLSFDHHGARFGLLLHDQYQNLGLGTQLLQFIERELIKQQAPFIQGHVLQSNIAMNHLLQKRGYIKLKSRDQCFIWRKALL